MRVQCCTTVLQSSTGTYMFLTESCERVLRVKRSATTPLWVDKGCKVLNNADHLPDVTSLSAFLPNCNLHRTMSCLLTFQACQTLGLIIIMCSGIQAKVGRSRMLHQPESIASAVLPGWQQGAAPFTSSFRPCPSYLACQPPARKMQYMNMSGVPDARTPH